VARLAIRSHFALVDIGVAVGALVTDVGEDHPRMAARAGDPLMQSTQWIACLIVIKLRDCPDRLPSIYGVAVLAGNIEIAVWTSRALHRFLLAWNRRGHKQQPRDDQTRDQP
jgi:hypothetical protein